MNKGEFILWIDNGYEGWSPFYFDSMQLMLEHIQRGTLSKFIITRRLHLIPSMKRR